MGVKVAEVLKLKGYDVTTVAPEATIGAIAMLLRAHRIGATPVLSASGRLVGIISERDIVRGIAEKGGAVLAESVATLMTREVRTCAPDDEIVELMEVMTNQRIRHLPVLDRDQLVGIISIGDVVKQRLAEAHFEVEELRKYIASN